VPEALSKLRKVGFACRGHFDTIEELPAKLSGYPHRFSKVVIHPALGTTPVEFKGHGLTR
jgi:hypothetical protein